MTLDPFYAVSASDDQIAIAQRTVNKVTYELYAAHLEGADDVDLPALAVTIATRTGQSPYNVRNALFAIYELRNLPKLRAFVEATWIMDIDRIRGIIDCMRGLSKEFWAEFDERILKALLPRSPMQDLPTARTLKTRAQAIRKRLMPMKEEKEESLNIKIDDSRPLSTCNMRLKHDTMLLFQRTIELIQKRKHCDAPTAFRHLLDAKVKMNVNLHLYKGDGTVSTEDSHFWEEEIASLLKDATVQGPCETARGTYHFSPQQKAEIRGRDGTCRFPGCGRSARNADIDHVVPFSQGGATSIHNAQSLCREHHIMKTRRIVSASIDPDSFAVKWVMPDGSTIHTHPEGPLAPILRKKTYTLRNMEAQFFK
ncbi:HNH endonuclease signature motif containing protein [Corynebacterium kozikiae]|uniref:HNH endonuclease signature motif containing protein n=1 Tax=Corynebacterium kozikiae TaxID=2968469 RepID=UPI00211CBDEE|nr:HNH endonuclease signature motif containing protein [Corynebacterium sp. 76QC2CO]MCQ9343716.1 HNH endonuclease [Corynebacterium sp. 76QC2CO]